jgi:DNA-binding transcriptional ArsR family regulator
VKADRQAQPFSQSFDWKGFDMARIIAMTPQSTKPIEDVLCSKTRITIIKLLNDLGQLNVSDIAQRLGSNYAHALRNLTILQESDLVTQLRSGRTKYFRLNGESLKVRAVQKLLDVWSGEIQNEQDKNV